MNTLKLKPGQILSNIPSKFLQQALDDLDIIEKTKGYTVKMVHWHLRREHTCFVCLTGAVMARRCEIPDTVNYQVYPFFFEFEIEMILIAINRLRQGKIKWAFKDLAPILKELKIEMDSIPDFPDREITAYDPEDPEPFKQDIRQLIKDLAEAGL